LKFLLQLICDLAVAILAGDVVQEEPLYSSVAPVTVGVESIKPPKANAAVCVPATC
jgi:hypothetical protein